MDGKEVRKMSRKLRSVMLACVVYAGAVAFGSVAYADEEGPKCCQYGEECGTEELCCNPNAIGAMPCSSSKIGYCRSYCNIPPADD
jgi:hypothetical protein